MPLTQPAGSTQSLPIPLPIAGGTLTGDLVLNADPALALGAATKQFVEATAVNVANVPPLLLMAQNIY